MYFYPEKTITRLELEQDFPVLAEGLDNSTLAGAGLEKVENVGKIGPRREILKILVGNWVAQWDHIYKAWFYYNINTGLSSHQVFQDIF